MKIGNQQGNVGAMPIFTVQGNTGKKWYVMRAIGRKEMKVKETIETMLEKNADFAKYVSQVLVPTEKVKTVRNGKVDVKEKPLYSGYVFVEAELAGGVAEMLRSVPNVLGFLSDTRANRIPKPLSHHEVVQLLGSMAESQEVTVNVVEPFKVGDNIMVTDGPFNNFKGRVEYVDNEHNRLKVSVKIFGRVTPLELEYTQAKKA